MIRATASIKIRALACNGHNNRLAGVSLRTTPSLFSSFHLGEQDQNSSIIQSRSMHHFIHGNNYISFGTTMKLNNLYIGNSRSGLLAVPNTTVILSSSSSSKRRPFSTSSPSSTDNTSLFSTVDSNVRNDDNTNNIDVDEALNKLFEESQQQLSAESATTGTNSDAWYASPEVANAIVDWTPVWYNLADQAVLFVKFVQETTGWEYGWAIVGTTVLLRLCLFPVMIRAQQTTSRMAHLQPELNALKARYEALGTPSRQEQIQFANSMKALFARYEAKPFRAFQAPIINLPLFMGMFFGLKKMPQIYPEQFASGGMLWFPDLTIPDPYYVLPITTTITFLAVIEMGKANMMSQNAAVGAVMINVFRAMSLAMLPVCLNFQASMLCYWTANNILTCGQTALLKSHAVRKYFGIWDPPKPVPGMEPESIMNALTKLQKKAQGKALTKAEEMKRHNATVDAKKSTMRMVRASRAARRKGTSSNNNS